MISVNRGRIGEATEFIEFKSDRAKTRFVAQQGNSHYWFVFRIEPGKKGSVITLKHYKPEQRDLAVRYAQRAALRFEDALL
jgi:hypothetical protein